MKSNRTRWAHLLEHVNWARTRDAFGLSPRELDVVHLVISGHKQAAIASELDLSVGTVKTYVRRTYRKLRVCNRSELTLALWSFALEERDGRE